MTKKNIIIAVTLCMLSTLSGCSGVGDKSATMSGIYLVTSLLAIALLAGYCFLIKKKEPWFLVLFSAVVVVNVGYLALSVSSSLQEALLANRVAYLGSVFLPLSLLVLILKACKITPPKWLIGTLIALSCFVFLIAASPGYLDIYYKEVSLVIIDGVAILEKKYGTLHSLYLYYLLSYFTSMIGVIIYARITRKVRNSIHALLLLISVFVNIGVWLMEQFVRMNFEILSVSYIVTELFLLGISMLLQDTKIQNLLNTKSVSDEISPDSESDSTQSTTNHIFVSTTLRSETLLKDKCEYLVSKIRTLTPTEKQIFDLYSSGKQIKEVKELLSISDNTLKYHNRNIYTKLGVSNRKELIDVVASSNINK